MIIKNLTLFLLFALFCVINCKAQNNESFNVLSIPNGAYIFKAPPSYKTVSETSNQIVAWTKEALIDGTNSKGWSSAKDMKFPLEFIFELSEECIIEKFGFNTQCEKQYKGISAKDIKVEISTTSPKSGFIPAGEFLLKELSPTQYFNIQPTKARWIKVSILSNHGFKDYTELMEIEAIGKYAKTDVPKIDLTGDWESTWGLASFRQAGSNVNGCYKFRNGVIRNSGMERRIITYEWVEEGQNGIGHAVLVVNEEGNRLNGIWGFGDDLKKYGIWVFRKKNDEPSLCYQKNTTAENKENEEAVNIERMKTEIQEKGKIIVYGINFETNSATLKEESFNKLDEIFRLLEINKNMKLKIDGHTDNIGSNASNLKLSLNRAESVKKYLVNKGINDQRLIAAGKGEEVPIADNETQLGRAANRRVELLLQ